MTDREIKTLMDSIRNRPGYKGECVKPQFFFKGLGFVTVI